MAIVHYDFSGRMRFNDNSKLYLLCGRKQDSNCTHKHKTERESGSKGSERETTLQVESGDASERGQRTPLVALAPPRRGAI